MTGRRRRRRVAIVVARVVGVLLLAWVVWDAWAARVAERELQHAKTLGLALAITEAIPRPIPEAQNAAMLYLSVFEIDFARPNPRGRGLDRIKLGEQYRPTMACALAARAALQTPFAQHALAVLREASRRPQCQFPVPWGEGWTRLAPECTALRQAARLLTAQALLSAADGDVQDALGWLRVSCRVAQHASEQPGLTAQETAYAIYSTIVTAAQSVLALHPTLADGVLAWGDDLAQTDLPRRYRDAMPMDFATMLDVAKGRDNLATLEPMMDSFLGDDHGRFWLALELTGLGRPLRRLEAASFARIVGAEIMRSCQPYRVRPRDVAHRPDTGNVFHPGALLTDFTAGIVYIPASRRRDTAIARLDLLRAALLLEAHRSDHGTYPARLQELAREAPVDVFSGRPFIYRRHGRSYVLYSVGPDLRDDGGCLPAAGRNLEDTGDVTWRCVSGRLTGEAAPGAE